MIGAVVGGAAGGTVSDTRHKGVGTVAGAVIGGLIGSQVGKSSVKCYNGEYYAYSGHYYTPPAPPEGYQTLYFRDRPTEGYYDRVVSGPPSYGDGYGDQSNGGYASQPAPYHHYGDNSSGGSAYDNGASGGQYSSSDHGNSGQYSTQYDNDHSGQPYNNGYANTQSEGFRDDQGVWHSGHPRAIGWQDDNGQWHTGEVVAYGWRDRQGGWHEESQSQSSSSYRSDSSFGN